MTQEQETAMCDEPDEEVTPKAEGDGLRDALAAQIWADRDPDGYWPWGKVIYRAGQGFFADETRRDDTYWFADWVISHDAEVARKAWDEGHEAGINDEAFTARGLSTDSDAADHPQCNPYRAEQIGEEH